MPAKLKNKVKQANTKGLNPQESEGKKEPPLPQVEIKEEPASSQPQVNQKPITEFPIVTAVTLIAVAWFMVCIGIILGALA